MNSSLPSLRLKLSPLFSARLGNLALALAMLWYVALGLETELRLIESNPPIVHLMEDFGFYERAYHDALANGNAYAVLNTGQGFFYPPPALLLVGAFEAIDPAVLRDALYLTVNLAFVGGMVWGIARRFGYGLDRIWWWFPLAFAFAPILEDLFIGQINLFTEFGIFLLYGFGSAAPFLGGLGAALAADTKLVPVIFFAYLLAARRWRSILWGVGWLGASLGATALIIGWETILHYPEAFNWVSQWFTPGPYENAQSLVTIASGFGWIQAAEWRNLQWGLNFYLAALFMVSGVLAYVSRTYEPFFIILCLGSMVAPNVMWYHHFVFFLVPFLVWMAWSRLNPLIVLWCWIGLMLTQVDRFYWTQGLLPHLVAHVSMLGIAAWQVVTFIQARRKTQTIASRMPVRTLSL